MIKAVAWSLTVLFCLSGVIYARFAFFVKKEGQQYQKYRNRKRIAFHGLFSLILILQGIAFLFYYPFTRFGFLSTMLFVSFPYTGIVMGYYFNGERQRTIITSAITGCLVFLTVWKLIAFTELTLIARLPLNVCNIIIIHLVICRFFKSRILDNYIMCFGLIAGGINHCIGVFYDGAAALSSLGMGFFSSRMLEGALLHNLFLTYCGYAFITKSIVVDRRSAMLNMRWIIPLFAVFSFCNQIWETDFFFTGVYGITPQFLIDLYYTFPLRFQITVNHAAFDVHILYSLFLIGAAAAILWMVSTVLSVLQKRLPAV